MIGLPSTYRGGQQRPPTDPENGYDEYLRQMAASGLPSSTMPSAAHSHANTGSHVAPNRALEQHPSAPTLDNSQFGVFEPQTQSSRQYSNFAPLLNQTRPQPQPQQQQQHIPGEFVPGTGAGTSEYYRNRDARPHVQTQHGVSRSSTNQSGYSDRSSSANMSSPVRSGMLPNQTYASPPGAFPAPSNPNATSGYGYQNTFEAYNSSGSEVFASSDQYTSPGMSPDKYMSSPEQIQLAHQHQHMSSIFATTSPTRPGMGVGAGMAMGAGGSGGWQSVDNTAGIAPAHSGALGPIVGAGGSGGSHSSAGGGGGGAYSASSGGYASAHSGPGAVAGLGAGPRPIAGRQGGGTVGRSHSISGGTRHGHSHSQSQSGHLAPPVSHKRARPNYDTRRDRDEAEEDSESEEEGRSGGVVPQAGTVKRL